MYSHRLPLQDPSTQTYEADAQIADLAQWLVNEENHPFISDFIEPTDVSAFNVPAMYF